MYGSSIVDAASSVCSPLGNVLSKNSDIPPFAKKIKSVGNISSTILRRNSSQMSDELNLQRFFDGWPNVEKFRQCFIPSGGNVIERVNENYTQDRTKPSLNLVPNGKTNIGGEKQEPCPSSLKTVLAKRCAADSTTSKKTQSTIKLPAQFSSAKKGQAPLPPFQAVAYAVNNDLVVDGLDSAPHAATANNKKSFFDHLSVIWNRVDLPLIDILSPKY